MAKQILDVEIFNGGISDEEKRGIPGSFYFGEKLDIYKDPSRLTILPKSLKVSGTDLVTDLVKWIVSGTPYDTNKYFYSEGGRIYRETSAGVWSLLGTIAASDGQGLELVNDYLYYTQRTQIGRYGPLSGTPSFTDNWQTGLTDTTNTKFAPIKAFMNGFVVGHGNKVGFWDGSTWTLAKLTLPTGLEIRAIEIIDEYVVLGTWRGTAITDNEEGYAFFWDGTASSYNFFTAIPEGGINALLNSRNRLLSIIGSSGYIYINSTPFQKLQQIPLLGFNKYVEVLPGAMTNFRGLSCLGISGNTDSADIKQGVYLWGSKSEKNPEVLNFGFPISTGTTTGTTLKIGACKGIGNSLYIGWRDGASYGVDKILITNDPYANATYQALIFGNGRQEQLALTIKVEHLALVSSESIQIGYKTNRASSYTTGDVNSTVGSTKTELQIPASDARFKEFQFETILATTGTTAPTVTYIGLEFDGLIEEEEF